jgi:hypothetical protein
LCGAHGRLVSPQVIRLGAGGGLQSKNNLPLLETVFLPVLRQFFDAILGG